jgi:polar amino acid transport system ATP-binding protein
MKLHLDNLSKTYDKNVLKDINLKVEDKKVIGIIGPSGGGKSTLLRILAGIEEADQGSIAINGSKISKENMNIYHKKIGFVFQNHSLFQHLSVLKNEAEKKAKRLLKKFGLIEHIHKKPSQLSGGQSQRVSIVRSLSIDPDILFFDEPTSALDPILTFEVLETIIKLREEEKDFIIVTHEIGFAKEVADYIVFIDKGSIIEHGTASILDTPKSPELIEFLSKVFSWHQK